MNLGVGKPYQENIDERLEDWMDYRCYLQSGEKEKAQESLQKIIQFKSKIENTVSNFLPANHLVSAWAMEKLNGKTDTVEWLNAEVKKYPDNKIVEWCKQVFENEQKGNIDPDDSGVRLLERLMQLK